MGSRGIPALADEQAALRSVATLAASAAPQATVFAAVAGEVGRMLQADRAYLARYNADGTATAVATWSTAGDAAPVTYHGPIRKDGLAAAVRVTGRPVLFDPCPGDSFLASRGIRSSVIGPITVEGRLWGFMGVAWVTGPSPAGTEARLAGFTELMAAAIANADTREELHHVAAEQAAMRRVATLVARGAPPQKVFAAVAAEVGRVLAVDFTFLSRYTSDAAATIVGGWARTGADQPLPVGAQMQLGGRNVHTLVFQSRRPVRIDNYAETSGPAAIVARELCTRSAAGVPISLEGRLWGVMFVSSQHEQPLPAATEARLAEFTELVAMAVANAEARSKLHGFADEQAALRRVATLVARGGQPEEVFSTVTAEVGRLLSVDLAILGRYGPGTETLVAASGRDSMPGTLGIPARLGGNNVATLVFETGRPARIDSYLDATGEPAAAARAWGLRGCVGVPVNVEGRLWGVMYAASTGDEPLPADTETRLAVFTELVAAAVANAEARAALTTSRSRIVAAADAARQRIERDLHDGVQQQLVSLILQLRSAQAAVPAGARELSAELDQVAAGLTGTLDELRELARGIHPAILADGGLGPALKTLARRCPIPVRLDVLAHGRPPQPAEVCAYYVASEALTNAAKHSRASAITVQVLLADDVLEVRVRDNGAGGAGFGAGSGLVGLKDRVEALGGQFTLDSPVGGGTSLSARLPLGAQPS